MRHAMITPLTDSLRAQRSPIPKLLIFWTIAIALVTSAVSPAEAQRIYSIGSLNTGDSFINAFEGFRERMTELGYRERQNVRYQYYNSRGNEELLRTIAHKLVHDKVDLIVLFDYCNSSSGTSDAGNTHSGRLFERGKLSETFQELFRLW
jgi:hypothetical protein